MAVTALTDFSKYKGKISNSGHDERNRYTGGKAGDQIGTEWAIRTWYDRPWDTVIRFTDINIAYMLATLSIYAAENNKVGYDQGNRYSYWNCLSKVNYDPRKITTACEEDCSAGVLANSRAALELTGHSAWAKKVSIYGYTGNLERIIKQCGAKVQVFKTKAYTKSTAYLRPGDILLNTNYHVCVNLGWGSKATKPSNTPAPNVTGEIVESATNNRVKYTKTLQHALNVSYALSLKEDGDPGKNTQSAIDNHYLYYHKNKPIKNAHVRWWQEMLNLRGYGLVVDGSFGPKTDVATRAFQNYHSLKVDGLVGVKTHLKMLELV